MKKILALLAVLTAVWCASCSKDDDKDPLNDKGGEGVITMVVDVKGDINPDEDVYFYIHSFKEGEIITVDWGDGSVEEFKTVAHYDEEDDEYYGYWTDELEHSYARNKSYTITIKGNIKELSYGNDYEDEDDFPAPLTSLDVSRCPALEYLDCYSNNLTTLDVSKNTALKELECLFNKLTTLDVSKNTALKELDCENNNLTSLDVSKNVALERLFCENSNLTSLDVSGCIALEYLDCYGNNLTTLDVSKNTALKELYCSDNNLTSLDVSKNTNLEYLDCENNNLTSLNVSGCIALEDLDCKNNKFSASALNKIFTDLPQGKTWVDYGYTMHSTISIYGNPGTATCNRSIAEKKGWRMYN